jgi:hypothetical protein
MSQAQTYGGLNLQQIQNLPTLQLRKHMQKYVNKNWGKVIEEGETKQMYKIEVELQQDPTYEKFTVQAYSEEEAEELADLHVEKHFSYDDYELCEIRKEE